MSIVADSHPFVVGVDTHARNHVFSILIPATAAVDATEAFPTTTKGIARAIAWVARRTGADLATLWVIEGAASYGSILAGQVAQAGYLVAEAARMNARAHRAVGKSDELDSQRIAAAVLPLAHDQLRYPRLDEGARATVQTLLTARDSMTHERVRHVNALTALLRTTDLGLDARKSITQDQITTVARWHGRTSEDMATATARTEAIRLAKRIRDLDTELSGNNTRLEEAVTSSQAAVLLEEPGIGPVTAAICLAAWSHTGRVRDDAAFASLAGASPIPASSGNTHRHRLNRGGDRRLNKALHTIAMTRMRCDERTRHYVARREAQGLSSRDIRRCLKRYIARQVYRSLNTSARTQAVA